MYSSYKNCIIDLNGSGIIADNVSINVNGSINDRYLANRKFSQGQQYPEQAVGGTLSVGYYLSGEDPIKKHIYHEQSGISGSFGGVSFPSGYLTQYDVRLNPNQPVYISAEINFFDHFSGDFTPQTQTLESQNLLNGCDISIDGTGLGDLTKVRSASLSFRNDTKANYEVITGSGVTNIKPDRILFGKKILNTRVNFDNYSGDLSIFGDSAQISFELSNKEGVKQTEYVVKGRTSSKQLSTSSDNVLSNSFSIRQSAPSEDSTISSISVLSGSPGDEITVSGENLHLDPTFCIGGYCDLEVIYVDDKTVKIVLPDVIIPSGNILAKRPDDGEIISRTEDNFQIIRPTVSIGGVFLRV